MSSRLSTYIRQHHVGFVAIFLALAGGAYALPGRNQVDSGDIRKENVKAADLATNAVTNPKVADNAVGSAEVIADSLRGGDVDESSLGEVPSAASAASSTTAANAGQLDGLDSADFLRGNAAAGGDLAGSFPSPNLAAGAVGTGDFGTLPAARAFNSASVNLVSGAPTDLTLNSERFDTADLHSTSSNTERLTAPVAGTYVVGGHIAWSQSATGAREVRIERNSTAPIATELAITAGTGVLTVQSVMTVTRLSAGDFVNLNVTQYSGGDLGLVTFPESSPELAMAWIGP